MLLHADANGDRHNDYKGEIEGLDREGGRGDVVTRHTR